MSYMYQSFVDCLSYISCYVYLDVDTLYSISRMSNISFHCLLTFLILINMFNMTIQRRVIHLSYIASSKLLFSGWTAFFCCFFPLLLSAPKAFGIEYRTWILNRTSLSNTMSILLNIMFHAPMGRFQLELIYCVQKHIY